MLVLWNAAAKGEAKEGSHAISGCKFNGIQVEVLKLDCGADPLYGTAFSYHLR